MQVMLSIGIGVLIYCGILLLLSQPAQDNDRISKRISALNSNISGKSYNAVEEEMSVPLYDRIVKPFLLNISEGFKRLLPKNNKKVKEETVKNDVLRDKLNQAGIAMTFEEYKAAVLVAVLVCGSVSVLITFVISLQLMYSVLIVLISLVLPWLIARFSLEAKVKRRKTSIEKQLPEVLDLLSISVEAGLGFEQAMFQISHTMEGALVDELVITYREMSMGRTRKQALTLLAERCGVDEVRTFIGAIIQAGQLGISIKNVLHTQAAAMRLSRKNKVKEKVAKVSTKILIPMVAFIFPVIFIILLGPSVLNIMNNFG